MMMLMKENISLGIDDNIDNISLGIDDNVDVENISLGIDDNVDERNSMILISCLEQGCQHKKNAIKLRHRHLKNCGTGSEVAQLKLRFAI